MRLWLKCSCSSVLQLCADRLLSVLEGGYHYSLATRNSVKRILYCLSSYDPTKIPLRSQDLSTLTYTFRARLRDVSLLRVVIGRLCLSYDIDPDNLMDG